MEILHINNTKTVDHLNKYIKSGKDVFILIYMEGCGPCNQVRPEWTKLEKILKNKSGNKRISKRSNKSSGKHNDKYSNVVIANVESDDLDKITLNKVPEGFPSIKYISNKGIEEDYNNDRSVTALMEWVNSKTPKKTIGKSTIKHKRRNTGRTKKRFSRTRRGRK
jgi:hypothetical protein